MSDTNSAIFRKTEWRRVAHGLRYAFGPRIFKRCAVLNKPTTPIFLIALLFSIASGAAAETRLLVLGDSLAAGYGLPPELSFPAQLEKKLKTQGHAVKVLNGGVSGDTSAGGRARLDWALADRPDLAIVQLGANDGLRGLDPAAMRDNLDAIIATLKEKGVGVMLAGMLAPPNMGPDYETDFNAVYPALAEKHDVVYYPFFLDGVAAVPSLNQGDGIHPNSDGVAEIVDRITPYVVRLLGREKGT